MRRCEWREVGKLTGHGWDASEGTAGLRPRQGADGCQGNKSMLVQLRVGQAAEVEGMQLAEGGGIVLSRRMAAKYVCA
jgi:hypothetical protein